MVAINTDFGIITPSIGGGLPVKEDGWYRGMVIDSKSVGTKDSSTTGNTMLVLTIAFQDGSQYIERLNYWHSNDDAKRIAGENLAAMLAAMGLTGQQLHIQDTQQFHNLPFDLYLAIEVSKGDKGDIRQNRMKAVRLPDGKILGNVPAALPPGAKAAAAGFAAPAAPAAPPAAFGAQPGAPAAPPQPWGGAAPGAGPAAPQAPAAPAAPAFGAAPQPPAGFPPAGAAPGGFPPAPQAPGGFPPAGAAPGPWGGPAA